MTPSSQTSARGPLGRGRLPDGAGRSHGTNGRSDRQGRWTDAAGRTIQVRSTVAAWAFAAALTVGAALRFWQLAAKPDWQYDEGVYTRVAENLLLHGTLNEHLITGAPWQPFLYQPPFYFLVLAKWFGLTGGSIYHARILGVLAALATLALLFALIWKLHGPAAALFALVPITFDGWLLYVERVSYMENLLMLIIVAGLLLYQRALERPTWQRFLAAGLVVGFAASFKQTGVSVLPALALCWLILRREHKGHMVMLGAALAVFAAYIVIMMRLFDVPGHDWFIQQSLVQVRRVLGLQASGGTLTSPFKFLHLIAAQYRIFLPSLLAAFAAFAIGMRRVALCYRVRDWRPLQYNALLFSWMASATVVFGVSTLRFPQYFQLILVPMYCFLWTELFLWRRTDRWKVAVAGLAVVAGLASFALRVPGRDGNAFDQVQRYAAASIPAHSVVVTEETVGDLISQPWCRVEFADKCPASTSYAITWSTYLQSSFKLGDPAFHSLMKGAVPIKSFTDFSGTATVWRLK